MSYMVKILGLALAGMFDGLCFRALCMWSLKFIEHLTGKVLLQTKVTHTIKETH